MNIAHIGDVFVFKSNIDFVLQVLLDGEYDEYVTLYISKNHIRIANPWFLLGSSSLEPTVYEL